MKIKLPTSHAGWLIFKPYTIMERMRKTQYYLLFKIIFFSFSIFFFFKRTVIIKRLCKLSVPTFNVNSMFSGVLQNSKFRTSSVENQHGVQPAVVYAQNPSSYFNTGAPSNSSRWTIIKQEIIGDDFFFFCFAGYFRLLSIAEVRIFLVALRIVRLSNRTRGVLGTVRKSNWKLSIIVPN